MWEGLGGDCGNEVVRGALMFELVVMTMMMAEVLLLLLTIIMMCCYDDAAALLPFLLWWFSLSNLITLLMFSCWFVQLAIASESSVMMTFHSC